MLTEEQKKLRGVSVNSIDNCMLLGFFLGDDNNQDFGKYMPELSAELAELALNGITILGEHYDVQLCAGGDYKFVRSILGFQDGGNTTFGCSKCHCHKKDYGCTKEAHRCGDTVGMDFMRDENGKPVPTRPEGKTYKEQRATDQLRPRLVASQKVYTHQPPSTGEYTCTCCGAVIKANSTPEDRYNRFFFFPFFFSLHCSSCGKAYTAATH